MNPSEIFDDLTLGDENGLTISLTIEDNFYKLFPLDYEMSSCHAYKGNIYYSYRKKMGDIANRDKVTLGLRRMDSNNGFSVFHHPLPFDDFDYDYDYFLDIKAFLNNEVIVALIRHYKQKPEIDVQDGVYIFSFDCDSHEWSQILSQNDGFVKQKRISSKYLFSPRQVFLWVENDTLRIVRDEGPFDTYYDERIMTPKIERYYKLHKEQWASLNRAGLSTVYKTPVPESIEHLPKSLWNRLRDDFLNLFKPKKQLVEPKTRLVEPKNKLDKPKKPEGPKYHITGLENLMREQFIGVTQEDVFFDIPNGVLIQSEKEQFLGIFLKYARPRSWSREYLVILKL